MVDARRVFIIHGRNLRAAREMANFVHSLGLETIAFEDLRARMGGTPTVDQVVLRGMSEAHAVIALFTGDEFAALEPSLRSDGDVGEQVSRWQARPNVIFEAGIAFGRDRERVVFVRFGQVALFTDVAGVHVLRPTNDVRGDRNVLRNTLGAMGCPINSSSAWMHSGDFEGSSKEQPQPADPFASARVPQSLPRERDEPPILAKKRPLVLIIDEEEFIRDIVGDFIAMEGFEPIVAASGIAALNDPSENPRVAIASLELKDLPGATVIEALVARYPGCVCVGTTASPSPRLVLEATKAGARAVLKKPFKVEEVTSLAFEAVGWPVPTPHRHRTR